MVTIDNRFKDQVMIITGAAGGIGKATAIRAAKEGAKLILGDKKEKMSQETLTEIQKITDDVTFIIGDLTDQKNCEQLIHTAIEKYGKIDILINNAGIMGLPAPVHAMSEEMFRNVLDTNIMIAFYCSKLALPYMMEKKHGAIVNVTSVAGITGFPGHSAYVTSKHALSGLTRNMAMDYASYGIRVNAINPGTTQTPMYDEALEFLASKRKKAEEMEIKNNENMTQGKTVSPQQRVAEAEEVANAILFLASEEASNITGVFLPVDGGFTAF